MRNSLIFILFILMSAVPAAPAAELATNFVLVIHGGAGVVPREELTPEHEQAARATLAEALRTGHALLARGGAAADAVVASIKVLEDSPLFNAGRGSVLAADGNVSMDASIMDGARDLRTHAMIASWASCW